MSYEIGTTVIDTLRKICPTVEKAICDCYSGTIYVLYDYEVGIYMAFEKDLIPYDKYYYDKYYFDNDRKHNPALDVHTTPLLTKR
jgi:hypothetical protein